MKTACSIILLTLLLNTPSRAQEARLVWSDEFEVDGFPDPKKWTYDVGDHGWGNDELEYYSQNDLKNARIENGNLIIEAHADATLPKGYTSAPAVKLPGNMAILKSKPNYLKVAAHGQRSGCYQKRIYMEDGQKTGK